MCTKKRFNLGNNTFLEYDVVKERFAGYEIDETVYDTIKAILQQIDPSITDISVSVNIVLG